MKKEIWKYKLGIKTEIKMPKGAEILTAREQGEDVCIWALVDPSEKVMENRSFEVVGTGLKMEYEGSVYIGTAHLYNSTLVLHVFEYKTT